MKRRRRLEKGLTLPEVLVASVIGLIGLGALLSTYMTGRFINTAAQHYNQAMSLARAQAEYLKSLLYQDLAALPFLPDSTIEADLGLDVGDNGNFIPCTRITTLEEQDDGIAIDVTVTWNERSAGAGSRIRTYNLKTWVYSPKKPGST